ncbi:MAG: zinc-dependent alcohol dehydrogenase family protein [bacterium]|nr:zinc-dependent alcohol dehydrogenase family protein [bacterium]
MWAMRIEGIGQPLVLRQVQRRDPGEGEIVLRVEACGVCRTDLHLIDGDLAPATLPITPGHEIVGRVIETRAPQAPHRVGDRVGIPWLAWTCGTCADCRAGRENLCARARFSGFSGDGGFAQEAIVDARFAFSIPDLYGSVEAAPLLCAGLIGYRSYRMSGDPSRLGLYGFGAAAHIVIQMARAEGREVYAFTRPEDTESQAFARELGAVWAGSSTDSSPEPLDAAILYAPLGELVPLALAAVRPGGTVVCAGIHMSDIPSFPYALLWGERRLISVANLTRADGLGFFEFITRNPVTTHVTPFELRDANRALDCLRNGAIQGAAVLVCDG